MKIRITAGLAFAGITAAMIAAFAPTAEATTPRVPARMTNAVKACRPAPVTLRPACESLHLRPRIGDLPKGAAVVAECFDGARAEARPQTKVWKSYLRACVLSNITHP